MKISQLSEYILGCCEVYIEGWYGENLLNIATDEGIELWQIHRTAPDTLTARVFLMDLTALKELPERYRRKLAGVSITERSRWGLPTQLYKIKRRGGLLCGMVLFTVLLIVMSSFIWDIRVSGVYSVSEEQVLEALCDEGLYIGAFTSGHDLRLIKLQLMERFENIAFVGINIQGSTAYIEVTERRMPPNLASDDEPCNIYAKRDGVLVSAETYKGVAYVKNHEAVKKDQLLVGGIYDSRIVGYRLVTASAKMMALTKRDFEAYCPVQRTEYVLSGRETTKYSVKIFGLEIKIPFIGANDYEYCVSVRKETPLRVDDSVFPICLIREEISEKIPVSVTYDAETAEKVLRDELDEMERISLFGLDIVEKYESFSEDGSGFYGKYTYTVLEDIAEARVIETEAEK